jgi:hypothetical protein
LRASPIEAAVRAKIVKIARGCLLQLAHKALVESFLQEGGLDVLDHIVHHIAIQSDRALAIL